jgi:flagellar FliL protein
VLPKGFTFNLTDGHYATATVGLVLAPGQTDGATAESAGTTTPAGIGTLPEEPLVRDIITNIVTNETSPELITVTGRQKTEKAILDAIKKQTDVKVSQILFTDLAIQ